MRSISCFPCCISLSVGSLTGSSYCQDLAVQFSASPRWGCAHHRIGQIGHIALGWATSVLLTTVAKYQNSTSNRSCKMLLSDVGPFLNVDYFKHLLQNRWTDWHQIWYIASLYPCLQIFSRPLAQTLWLLWANELAWMVLTVQHRQHATKLNHTLQVS